MGLISTFNFIERLVTSIWSHVSFISLACVFVSISFIQIHIPPIAIVSYYFLALGLTMKIYAIRGGIQ